MSNNLIFIMVAKQIREQKQALKDLRGKNLISQDEYAQKLRGLDRDFQLSLAQSNSRKGIKTGRKAASKANQFGSQAEAVRAWRDDLTEQRMNSIRERLEDLKTQVNQAEDTAAEPSEEPEVLAETT